MAKFMEIQEKYEDSHLGNFRRIYPGPGSAKYDKYFSTSVSLYQETAAFKARTECARLFFGCDCDIQDKNFPISLKTTERRNTTETREIRFDTEEEGQERSEARKSRRSTEKKSTEFFEQ